jgi:hypothetical protein
MTFNDQFIETATTITSYIFGTLEAHDSALQWRTSKNMRRGNAQQVKAGRPMGKTTSTSTVTNELLVTPIIGTTALTVARQRPYECRVAVWYVWNASSGEARKTPGN